MTITLRSTKGSQLTHAEMDGNFQDLDTSVTALEGTVAEHETRLDNGLTTDQVTALGAGQIKGSDGSLYSLSEVVQITARLTASGLARSGPSYYRGIKVAAISGGPQVIKVYDSLTASGKIIDTIVVNSLGAWLWDRLSDMTQGRGGRVPCDIGVYVDIVGGTSRGIDPMVEAQ